MSKPLSSRFFKNNFTYICKNGRLDHTLTVIFTKSYLFLLGHRSVWKFLKILVNFSIKFGEIPICILIENISDITKACLTVILKEVVFS